MPSVQLACFSNQPGSVGERAHRHRAVTGGHAAEAVPRDQCGTHPEARRSKRRHDAGRPGADHHYIISDIVRLGHRAMLDAVVINGEFAKNARCEGRYAMAVPQPAAVEIADLTP